MRLRDSHIARLSPVERYVYRSLIGPVIRKNPRDEYLALSSRYIEGDEHKLPYPERSKRGIMLTSLAQNLAACERGAAILRVNESWARFFVKKKLLGLGEGRIYSVTKDEFVAAVTCPSPFDYWRNASKTGLPGLSGRVLCAIDPPSSFLKSSDEYSVKGVLVRPSQNPSEMQYFKEAANLGLVHAHTTPGWLWLYEKQV